MTTAIAPVNADNRKIKYTPLGGKDPIELTIGVVRKFLCTPTKKGKQPDDGQVVRFMMLCKARELDPWVGDAYLVGYDSFNDGPQFSLITAHQALLKRAELCPTYNGLEAGVIVKTGDSVHYRAGDLVFEGETLLGGWARCHRKDRDVPAYDAIKLSTFDTGLSRWKKDPAGMIVKCAEASVLRQAFPSQNGGLYTRDEMDSIETRTIATASFQDIPVPMPKAINERDESGDDDQQSEVIESNEELAESVEDYTEVDLTALHAEFDGCKKISDVLDVAGRLKARHPQVASDIDGMRMAVEKRIRDGRSAKPEQKSLMPTSENEGQ